MTDSDQMLVDIAAVSYPEYLGDTPEEGRKNAAEWLTMRLQEKGHCRLTERQTKAILFLSDTIREIESIRTEYLKDRKEPDDIANRLDDQIGDLKDIYIDLVEDELNAKY